jgi:alpha-methylacyl-CoA racemase
MCGMLLADLGAEVLRLDRAVPTGLGVQKPTRFDLLNRGKRVLAVDLKHPEGIALARRLVAKADATIEGLRPGVMERLGLGPADCLGLNPRLVYGRVTGFGQEGPLSLAAGHDLNYIAMSGALHAIGRAGAAPTPPLNLVGDFGGGGAAGFRHRQRTAGPPARARGRPRWSMAPRR